MSLSYFQPLSQFAIGLSLLLLCFFSALLYKGSRKEGGVNPGIVIGIACSFLLLITAYSLYRTRFNSVNLGFLLALTLFLFGKKHFGKPAEEIPSVHKWGFLAYLSGIYVFWFAFLLLTLQLEYVPDLIRSPERDLLYYSELTSQLSRGLEEMRILPAEVAASRTPYHYLELWLNNLLANTLQVSPFQTLVLVTRAVLLTLVSLAFWAVAKVIWGKKKHAALIYFAPLLLLLKPVAFYSFSNLTYFLGSHLFAPKAEVFFLFVLLELFLFLQYRKFTLFGFTLLLVASITAVPALSVFVALLFVIQWFGKREFVFRSGVLCFFITLAFILLYYFINGSNKVPGSNSLNAQEALQVYSVRSAINVMAGNLIYLFYALLPFLLLFIITLVLNKVPVVKYFRDALTGRNWLLSLLLGLIVISSILSGLIYVIFDSYQIFMLISITAITVICAFLLVDLLANYSIKPASLVLIGLLWALATGRHLYDAVDYNPREAVSKEFFEQAVGAYQNGLLRKGGFIPASGFYRSLYEWNDKLSWLGQYLYYIDPSIRTTNIDMNASMISKNKLSAIWQQKVLEISDYPKYCRLNEIEDKQSCQESFIEGNDIDFIITGAAVSARLRPMFSDSLLDAHSGNIMYLRGEL